MFINPVKAFLKDESGQGITEYGAVLAFVAILIAIAFGGKGLLASALQNSVSSVSNNISQLTAAAS